MFCATFKAWFPSPLARERRPRSELMARHRHKEAYAETSFAGGCDEINHRPDRTSVQLPRLCVEIRRSPVIEIPRKDVNIEAYEFLHLCSDDNDLAGLRFHNCVARFFRN